MSAPLFLNGGIVVADGVIVAIGQRKDLKRDFPSAQECDLGKVILMPGLVNAHCHLDYTMMRGRLPSQNSFTAWVQELNKIKFSLLEKDILLAVEEGARELYSWGCTTAANIIAFPSVLKNFPKTSLRILNFLEVMDIRGPQQGEEVLQIVENFLGESNNKHYKKKSLGLSPHAPQTVSPSLFKKVGQLTQQYQVPFCTHLAESEEEFEMFTRGRGRLFDFLKSYGRNMDDCGFQTPVHALLGNELLPHGALLVHMNCLTRKDRELLMHRGDDFFIVHCPKTHRFFNRAPFDWRFFKDHGYRLTLGTDSLASNDSLNLFSEMQLFATTAPELNAEEILKMVTLYPAEALGMKGKLGELAPGACADMITIPFEGGLNDVFQSIIENKTLPRVFGSKSKSEAQ